MIHATAPQWGKLGGHIDIALGVGEHQLERPLLALKLIVIAY